MLSHAKMPNPTNRNENIEKIVESMLINAGRTEGLNIPERAFPEVMGTILNIIHEQEDVARVPAIIYEAGRKETLTSAVEFNPEDWYSEKEIQDRLKDKETKQYTLQEWESSIDPDFRRRVWEEAIERVLEREKWNIIVACDGKCEDMNLVETLSDTGYEVHSCTYEDAPKILAELKSKGEAAVVACSESSPQDAIKLHEKIKKIHGQKYANQHFIATISDSNARNVLTDKGINHILTTVEEVRKDDLVTKLDRLMKESDIMPFKYSEEEKEGRNAHFYTVFGPTCAGKSVVVKRVVRKIGTRIVMGGKSTTRTRSRETDVDETLPFSYERRKFGYFAEWEKANKKYGLDKTILDPIEIGNDVITSIADPAAMPQISSYVRRRYNKRDVEVPILITADKKEILPRFMDRENTDMNEARLREIEDDVKIYEDAELRKRFYTIILNNSKFHTEDELNDDRKIADLHHVVDRLQTFIQRTRDCPIDGYTPTQYHSKFVDDVVRNLTGQKYSSFDELIKASTSQKLELTFEDDVAREIINTRKMPADYIDYGLSRKVVGVWKSHGRGVILLEQYTDRKNGVDPDRDVFAGIIEKQVGYQPWLNQDRKTENEGSTSYGLLKCKGMSFFGGMHFAITDKLPAQEDGRVYALDIVFVNGGNATEVSPLEQDDIKEIKRLTAGEINTRQSDIGLLDM